MVNATHEFFTAIREARNVGEYCNALSRAAHELEFEYFSFGMRMPFPLTEREYRIVTNYSPAWMQRYQSEDYITIDPTVQHGLQSLAPLTWNAESLPEQTPFWQEAQAHGLKHGCAQPCRGVEGTIGMLTFARSGEKISEREMAEKLPVLSLTAIFSHEVFARLTLQSSPEFAVPKLTARELEVLRWTAEGKFSVDISKILGIAERTVNFHISNCMKKLGATSKTSAAVQAALWGLL